MASFWKPIEQPVDKKKAQDLYSKYMLLALETRTTGDRALFEDYYQRAEYYLHLMNEVCDGLPIMPGKPPQQGAIAPLPFKGSFLHHKQQSVQCKRGLKN